MFLSTAASPLRARLRNSALCDLYRQQFNAQYLADRAAQLAFYQRLILPGDLVFDIGANVGDKTDVFLRLGAKVVAVDPDEANLVTLANRFHRYRLRPYPVQIVGTAVSEDCTPKEFRIHTPGSALNTLSAKWADTLQETARYGAVAFEGSRMVPCTTLDALIQHYGQPAYIKIDVEGHEAGVLKGLSRPVRLLSFEVNLPEFRSEGLACIQRLANLASGEFTYATDQGGMAMPWVAASLFASRFAELRESCVEVFWRS